MTVEARRTRNNEHSKEICRSLLRLWYKKAVPFHRMSSPGSLALLSVGAERMLMLHHEYIFLYSLTYVFITRNVVKISILYTSVVVTVKIKTAPRVFLWKIRKHLPS